MQARSRLRASAGRVTCTADLVRPLPELLRPGSGTALPVIARCRHAANEVSGVRLLWDDCPMPVKLSLLSRDRRDIERLLYAVIWVPSCQKARTARLSLRASLPNGRTARLPLAQITLEPGSAVGAEVTSRPASGCSVVICMATYNPPADLLGRQVASIRSQTHQDWQCIINDDCSESSAYAHLQRLIATDARFQVYRNARRLGFYRNFERCLGRVPSSATYVALTDQDDDWHPEKLTTLLRAFERRTLLAHSDMRIVDRAGRGLAEGMWRDRTPNRRDLASLLLCNTITGAACLFRRELLDWALPFPEVFGECYHDHWLGLVAMALGQVRFVPERLHDYVQHDQNVTGFRESYVVYHRSPLDRMLGCLRSPVREWRVLLREIRDAQGAYVSDLLRIEILARTLLARCGPALSSQRRRALNKVARADESLASVAWLALRTLCYGGQKSATRGVENLLLDAIAWKQCRKIHDRARSFFPFIDRQQRLSAPARAAAPVTGVA